MCLINAIEETLSKFETYIALNSGNLNINICKIYENQIQNLILELEIEHFNVHSYQIRLKNIVSKI